MQFWTANSLSERWSTARCASSYFSKTPSDCGKSSESAGRRAPRAAGPGPAMVVVSLVVEDVQPRTSALELVLLEQPAADDHPLDVSGALADEEHRRLAVQPLDLVLLGVAVAAMDAEGVLDDLLAVLRRQVLGHAGLEVVALAGVLLPRGHDHHLVGVLDLGRHLGDAEQHGLVLGDLLAERLPLLGVGGAQLEGAHRDAARPGGDVD